MRLFAQAGESGLVAGVDGGRGVVTASACTTTGVVAAAVATLTTTSSAAALAATASTAATGASGTSTGALGLDEARVKVNSLLGLALTLALGLAAGRGSPDLLLLVLVEGLGSGPLLVELAALVGRADLGCLGSECELLLGQLGEVVDVRDALVLGLGGLLSTILSSGGLLLGLSNGITSLLVLQLSVALVGAPRGGSLLVRSAKTMSEKRSASKDNENTYP